MPSPRKRKTANSSKKKLTVKVSTTPPSRNRSARIKAASEIKQEDTEDEKPTNSRRGFQKKVSSPRGVY